MPSVKPENPGARGAGMARHVPAGRPPIDPDRVEIDHRRRVNPTPTPAPWRPDLPRAPPRRRPPPERPRPTPFLVPAGGRILRRRSGAALAPGVLPPVRLIMTGSGEALIPAWMDLVGRCAAPVTPAVADPVAAPSARSPHVFSTIFARRGAGAIQVGLWGALR